MDTLNPETLSAPLPARETPHTPLPYMPQLDALRAFAVFAVFLQHFYTPEALPPGLSSVPWGDLGIRCFFVLSGFLITGILLHARDRAERVDRPLLHVLRQFYVRRFLRIFPLYYLVVAVAILLGLPYAREIWPWLVTYTTNLWIFTHWGEYPGPFSHFWTLAIEEQFYLVWPWVVLFAPKKWLTPACLLMVALALSFRTYAAVMNMKGIPAFVFTFSSLDALGLGALLALVSRHDPKRAETYGVRRALPAGMLLVIILEGPFRDRLDWRVSAVLFDLAVAMVFCGVIQTASRGFRGVAGRILESKPLLYLGKISYGMYVVHLFIPLAWTALLARMGRSYQEQGGLNFLLSSLATVGVAALSWHLFERPLNHLKRYFPYAD